MKYLSSFLIEGLHDQTEQNINKVITGWQQLPHIRLLASPGYGKWSAIQCLEHLNSYGRYYLPEIEKAITASQSSPKVYLKSGWLGNYFYKTMLPAGNGKHQKTMRSPKDHVPAVSLNVTDVLNEFISQQERLLQLLTKAKSVNIDKARVPVSIARFIKIKLGDTFLFLIAHTNRHMQQAQRALDTTCYDFVSKNYSFTKTT